MKLRNKKTGGVFDAIVREKSNGDGEYSIIVCNLRALRSARTVSSILGEYDTVAKFNEFWEDYKPKEPLIKDPKIRKAVRAWAEANEYPKTMELYYNAPNFVLRSDISTIEFDKEIEPLRHGDQHTITELCGEEEE